LNFIYFLIHIVIEFLSYAMNKISQEYVIFTDIFFVIHQQSYKKD